MFIQDQRGAIIKATKQALAQGVKKTTLDIARRLLPMLEDEAISQTTGLSIEDIQQLRRE